MVPQEAGETAMKKALGASAGEEARVRRRMWIALAALKLLALTGLFLVSDDGKQKRRLTPEGVDCFAGAWTGPR